MARTGRILIQRDETFFANQTVLWRLYQRQTQKALATPQTRQFDDTWAELLINLTSERNLNNLTADPGLGGIRAFPKMLQQLRLTLLRSIPSEVKQTLGSTAALATPRACIKSFQAIATMQQATRIRGSRGVYAAVYWNTNLRATQWTVATEGGEHTFNILALLYSGKTLTVFDERWNLHAIKAASGAAWEIASSFDHVERIVISDLPFLDRPSGSDIDFHKGRFHVAVANIQESCAILFFKSSLPQSAAWSRQIQSHPTLIDLHQRQVLGMNKSWPMQERFELYASNRWNLKAIQFIIRYCVNEKRLLTTARCKRIQRKIYRATGILRGVTAIRGKISVERQKIFGSARARNRLASAPWSSDSLNIIQPYFLDDSALTRPLLTLLRWRIRREAGEERAEADIEYKILKGRALPDSDTTTSTDSSATSSSRSNASTDSNTLSNSESSAISEDD